MKLQGYFCQEKQKVSIKDISFVFFMIPFALNNLETIETLFYFFNIMTSLFYQTRQNLVLKGVLTLTWQSHPPGRLRGRLSPHWQ